jgi:hypothetical protein
VAHSVGKSVLNALTPKKIPLPAKILFSGCRALNLHAKIRRTMMILKRLILVGLFASWLTPLISQNNLTLRFVSGTERSTSLTSLSKITFSGGNMLMTYINGSFEAIDLLSVQKIGFTLLNAIESVRETTALGVYPSPATDRMTLVNIPEGAKQATIFRLDGSVISRVQLQSASQDIDVSSIPSGFYLLKVNNTTVKFAKK